MPNRLADTERYRAEAAAARTQADLANNEEGRLAWLQLARRWDDLAASGKPRPRPGRW